MERSQRRTAQRPYARTARVNALLKEVLAETLERLADGDERLSLLTITDIECAPDLRTAVVYLASLSEAAAEGLGEHRRALQGVIGAQVRMKRVPTLSFAADPAVEAGRRVEEALRRARARDAGED